MQPIVIQIYTAVVCFAAIVCFVTALNVFLYDWIQFIWPEFTTHSYENNEKYNANESRYAAQSLVQTFILMCISFAFYWSHWRLANKIQ